MTNLSPADEDTSSKDTHGIRADHPVTAMPVPRRGVAAYIELTKPRITVLLLITCVAGAFCAAQGMPPLGTLLVTALGLALSSGGASALNHVIDRDIDRMMPRTAARPVAAGSISAGAAAVFGVVLMAAACALLWLVVHPVTAWLALAGGAFYVVVYTVLLKRTTVQNIVIGGAAGAVPPLVGWSSVDPNLGLGAWALFAIIFMWTPPHFWALAMLIRDEYAAAQVPMLPVVAGDMATARQIWWYTVLLAITTVIPVALGAFGAVFLVSALLLNGWLLAAAFRLRGTVAAAEGTESAERARVIRADARVMFLRSMTYLALVFAAAVIDQAVWTRTIG